MVVQPPLEVGQVPVRGVDDVREVVGEPIDLRADRLGQQDSDAGDDREDAQIDGEDAQRTRDPELLQRAHQRVEDQRHRAGGHQDQQDGPSRPGQRPQTEQGERQQDQLDPTRHHHRRHRRPRLADAILGGGAARPLAGLVLFASLPPSAARLPGKPDCHLHGSMSARNMKKTSSILFVGDVVGGIGRRTLLALLPELRERLHPTFVVVNGENAAGGIGITPKIADELFAAGIDVITLGNHTYRHREIYAYLDHEPRILRPANFLRSQPGHGSCVVARDDVRLGVISLVRQPVHERGPARLLRGRRRAPRAQGQGRPRARRHARRGDEREGRDGLAPRRPRDRRGRHPHPRPDRRRPHPRPAGPPTSPTSG